MTISALPLKYKREDILDITQLFPFKIAEDAVRSYLYRELPNIRQPQELHAYTLHDEPIRHNVTDESALANMGKNIICDLRSASQIVYKLILPSTGYLDLSHATAIAFDFSNAEKPRILFINSYGIDMPKELRDFLTKLFPEAHITFSTQVQQYAEQSDMSCGLLAEFNCRDLYYTLLHREDAIQPRDSYSARREMWEYVYSKIEEAPPPADDPTLTELFGEAVISTPGSKPPPPTMEQIAAALQYSITQEPDYEVRIDRAATIVRAYADTVLHSRNTTSGTSTAPGKFTP